MGHFCKEGIVHHAANHNHRRSPPCTHPRRNRTTQSQTAPARGPPSTKTACPAVGTRDRSSPGRAIAPRAAVPAIPATYTKIRGQTGLVLYGNGKPFLHCFIRFERVCENQVNANPVFPKYQSRKIKGQRTYPPEIAAMGMLSLYLPPTRIEPMPV
jgi:hypothetical protein